jgi:hypothetical protein
MALGIAICGGTVLVSTYVTKPCVAPARLPRLVVPAVKFQGVTAVL